MIEEQQPVKMTRRELITPDSGNMSNKLQANEFTHELANASLPSYLKNLYINFPNAPSHALKDQKIVTANTIRSFENEAIGKYLHTYFK